MFVLFINRSSSSKETASQVYEATEMACAFVQYDNHIFLNGKYCKSYNELYESKLKCLKNFEINTTKEIEEISFVELLIRSKSNDYQANKYSSIKTFLPKNKKDFGDKFYFCINTNLFLCEREGDFISVSFCGNNIQKTKNSWLESMTEYISELAPELNGRMAILTLKLKERDKYTSIENIKIDPLDGLDEDRKKEMIANRIDWDLIKKNMQ
jgi:hypothetical protein